MASLWLPELLINNVTCMQNNHTPLAHKTTRVMEFIQKELSSSTPQEL